MSASRNNASVSLARASTDRRLAGRPRAAVRTRRLPLSRPVLRRPSSRGYLLRAAVHPYALVAMMMAVVVGMWSGLSVPLVLVLHGLVVTFTSRTDGFRNMVDEDLLEGLRAEQTRDTEQLIIQMELEHQNELRALMRQVDTIRDNAQHRWNAVTHMVKEDEPLDDLLNTFLQLGIAYKAGRDSLRSADRSAIEEEIRVLRQRSMVEELPSDLEGRRLNIATRRAEGFDATRDELNVMREEMATVASVIHLMHEQSMKVMAPQSAGLQVEELLAELDGHSEALRELALHAAASLRDATPLQTKL